MFSPRGKQEKNETQKQKKRLERMSDRRIGAAVSPAIFQCNPPGTKRVSPPDESCGRVCFARHAYRHETTDKKRENSEAAACRARRRQNSTCNVSMIVGRLVRLREDKIEKRIARPKGGGTNKKRVKVEQAGFDAAKEGDVLATTPHLSHSRDRIEIFPHDSISPFIPQGYNH